MQSHQEILIELSKDRILNQEGELGEAPMDLDNPDAQHDQVIPQPLKTFPWKRKNGRLKDHNREKDYSFGKVGIGVLWRQWNCDDTNAGLLKLRSCNDEDFTERRRWG